MTVRIDGRRRYVETMSPAEVEETRRLVDLEAIPLSVALLLWLFAHQAPDDTAYGRAGR